MHNSRINSSQCASLIALLTTLATVSGCGDDEGAAATTHESPDASNDSDTSSTEGETDEPTNESDDASATSTPPEDAADTGSAPVTGDAGADVPTGDAGNQTSAEDEGEAWYVVPTQLYSPDFMTSTSYVPLVSSLDVEEIRITDAKELDGRASAYALGEWLFIASSGEPVVSRYTVNEDGSLKSAFRSISRSTPGARYSLTQKRRSSSTAPTAVTSCGIHQLCKLPGKFPLQA
jgi:hypothetical protein